MRQYTLTVIKGLPGNWSNKLPNMSMIKFGTVEHFYEFSLPMQNNLVCGCNCPIVLKRYIIKSFLNGGISCLF